MSGYSCLSQARKRLGKEWVIAQREEKERGKSLENMKQLLVHFTKNKKKTHNPASLKFINPPLLSSGHSTVSRVHANVNGASWSP